jgi:hypothetical protein
MIVNDITREHVKVGTIIQIGENNRVQLVRVREDFTKNLTFVSAALTVNGNTTGLSVTLKNEGNVTFRIFGLTLQGEFNTTQSWSAKTFGGRWREECIVKVHPEVIPFKLNGTSLIPLYGTAGQRVNPFSSVAIKPGETLTLNFNGVIALYNCWNHGQNPLFTVTPIVNGSYTLRLMGEGFQTFAVNATALP